MQHFRHECTLLSVRCPAGVIVPTVTQGPNVAVLNIKLEANMGTETTLVVLDLLELFIVNFRVRVLCTLFVFLELRGMASLLD